MKQENMEQINDSEINGNPEKLNEYLQIYREYQKKKKKLDNRISLFRLLAFLLLVGGVLVGWLAGRTWGWVIAFLALATFLFLICYHARLADLQEYLERFILVHERYLLRMQGGWETLPETGSEFLQETDYVSADLDVFGTGSLYQLLCVAHTPEGKKRLAQVLRQAPEETEKRKRRQQAVAELGKNSRFALHLEAVAMNRDKTQKPVPVEEPKPVPAWLKILAWVYPMIVVFGILGAVFSWWNAGVVIALFFVGWIVSCGLSGYCAEKTDALFLNAQAMKSNLYMLESIASVEFETEYLKELQQTVTGQGNEREGVIRGLRSLERLLAAANIKYNPILHWLLCGICLYDLHLAVMGADWQKKYSTAMEAGIQVLGELEMLSSLAVLIRIRQTVFPVLQTSASPVLHATELVHPLLPPEQAVPNSIDLHCQTIVITGSNMSGKTTFLRTLGLNLILAYAGAPICGQGLQVSQMRLFTSMRITDDVKHGISTFYAEILRIKEMVEYGRQERPMLCLIDEIFKGTNSADRIVGAETIIRRLSAPYSIVIVSTHDFELCDLAENYHFEESYTEDTIQFDYQLKKGKCTTTNALYLLKMAGLTEERKK